MDAVQIKNFTLATIAAIGSAVAHALGGWDAAMALLVSLMMADYLTGVLVAMVWQRSNKSTTGALDSKAGFKGLIKKGMILMLVWLGLQLDEAMGANYIRTAVILFFIGNEGLSLLENLGLMGVKYPAFMKRALEALKEPCAVTLTSDSKYLVDGVSLGWLEGWRARGWKKADKSPALNPDLWAVLLDLTDKHIMHYHWVKGHAENEYNNRCDELAVSEWKKLK